MFMFGQGINYKYNYFWEKSNFSTTKEFMHEFYVHFLVSRVKGYFTPHRYFQHNLTNIQGPSYF